MTSLLELHCFPTAAYFHILSFSDLVLIESHENYNKRSFRNRIRLLSSQGIFHFSIPLKKGKNKQMPILKVEICYDESWQDRLWKTLKTQYNSAPFFDHYSSFLYEMVFYTCSTLYEYNWNILSQLIKLLAMDVRIASTVEFIKERSDIVDLRNIIKLKSNLSCPAYPQVFHHEKHLESDLSIIDLLVNLGPESKTYLTKMHLKSKI